MIAAHFKHAGKCHGNAVRVIGNCDAVIRMQHRVARCGLETRRNNVSLGEFGGGLFGLRRAIERRDDIPERAQRDKACRFYIGEAGEALLQR